MPLKCQVVSSLFLLSGVDLTWRGTARLNGKALEESVYESSFLEGQQELPESSLVPAYGPPASGLGLRDGLMSNGESWQCGQLGQEGAQQEQVG